MGVILEIFKVFCGILGKKTAQPKLPVVLVQEDNEDDTQTYFEVEELDDEDPQEEVNSDSVFFFCGACNMNFESLDDHVKKYHKNESKLSLQLFKIYFYFFSLF